MGLWQRISNPPVRGSNPCGRNNLRRLKKAFGSRLDSSKSRSISSTSRCRSLRHSWAGACLFESMLESDSSLHRLLGYGAMGRIEISISLGERLVTYPFPSDIERRIRSQIESG